MSKQCQSFTFPTSRFEETVKFNWYINLYTGVLYFQSYSTRLLKLVDSNSVNKDDVLGSEDASLGAAAAAAARSLFGRAAPSGRSSSSKATVFTLGNRNFWPIFQ